MSQEAGSGRDRSAGVKNAIRVSARRLFEAGGFDQTGVRDIAADAGVNPAIVIRHFGSKEALFLRAMDFTDVTATLFDGPLEGLGERVVAAVVAARGRDLGIFGAVLSASGRPDVRAYLQRAVVARFADPLVERIQAPDAVLRAHLFAAQVVGLLTALSVYDDDLLLHAPAADVVAAYGPVLQLTLTGP